MHFLCDSLCDSRVKGDVVKKYCYPMKRILLLNDVHSDMRCRNAVTAWHKILTNSTNRSSFFSDYTFDLLWTWFLNIAGACDVFRMYVGQNRGVFNFLVQKDFKNQGFVKADRNSSTDYHRSRLRLYNISLPFRRGQALEYHNRRIEKTRAILQGDDFDFTEDKKPFFNIGEVTLSEEMDILKL